jgi:ABC-type branched-subunit amino acid transport system ATPase component
VYRNKKAALIKKIKRIRNVKKMLEINDLHAYYEKSHIIQGISFSVAEGEIVSLLGRNGVGRSTSIKAIMGEVEHTGSIKFKGEEIGRLPTHEIARRGLGYVPENRDIFPTMTTLNNLHGTVAGPWKICTKCFRIWGKEATYRLDCYPVANNKC